MPDTRSNSFHFVPVEDVARGAGAPCPIVDNGAEYDPLRSLFVRIKHGMRLCVTRTGDFDDATLAVIKERDQQVYADVSRKLLLDDFSSDLRKLALSPECIGCPKRAACGGCWTALGENVFQRDQAEVTEFLRTLEGAILDVGCGEGPYLDALADTARLGRIAYTGLDPDVRRANLLRSRHPWASFFAGTVADYLRAHDSDNPQLDHVLILRSYNHLGSPAQDTQALARLLRPGGGLMIVDNVAFGVVRSVAQAARAEVGPGEFEHYRNDGATEALAVLQGLPLRLTHRRDVGPSRSNEWMLRFQKVTRDA